MVSVSKSTSGHLLVQLETNSVLQSQKVVSEPSACVVVHVDKLINEVDCCSTNCCITVVQPCDCNDEVTCADGRKS